MTPDYLGSKYWHLVPEICRLYDAGYTYRQISAQLKCSNQTVMRMYAKFGQNKRQRTRRHRVKYNGHWYYRRSDGYYKRQIVVKGKFVGLYLHRIVWETEVGPIPEGHHIHHIDHNPGNNALSNLKCMTLEEHQEEHGHSMRGLHGKR